MSGKLAAVIQMTSTANKITNLATGKRLIGIDTLYIRGYHKLLSDYQDVKMSINFRIGKGKRCFDGLPSRGI